MTDRPFTKAFYLLIGYTGSYEETKPVEKKPLVDPARELGNGQRACAVCGAAFTPKRRLAATCGRKCKRIHTERIEARLMNGGY